MFMISVGKKGMVGSDQQFAGLTPTQWLQGLVFCLPLRLFSLSQFRRGCGPAISP